MSDSTAHLVVRLALLLFMGAGLTDSDDEITGRASGRVSRLSVRSLRRVTLYCPLCAALGRTIEIVAQVDTATRPTIIANLAGCPHARAFGEVGRLTLDQERQLITASLDAWELRRA